MCIYYKNNPYHKDSSSVILLFKKYLLSKNSINRLFIKSLNILKKNLWIYRGFGKKFYKRTPYIQNYFKNFNFQKIQTKLSKIIFWYYKIQHGTTHLSQSNRITAKLVLLDMIWSYKAWRHIRGYPTNGQRTWSNGKSVSKNNLLLREFRSQQLIKEFGKKRRKHANLIVLGQANNKLWFFTWRSEWEQARLFNLRKSKKKRIYKMLVIDLVSLAKGITGGYRRKGAATKFNKAKKRFKSVTIGLPIFFAKHVYRGLKTNKFPMRLIVGGFNKKVKKVKKKKKIQTKQKKKKKA